MCIPTTDNNWLHYFRSFIVDDTKNTMVTSKQNILGNYSEDEMFSSTGILLLNGYCQVLWKNMYRQLESDTYNELVKNIMSRDRFQYSITNVNICNNDTLKKNYHFAEIYPVD